MARAIEIPVFHFLEPIVVRKGSLEPSETGLASPDALAYLARQYDRFEAQLEAAWAGDLPSNLRLIDASRILDQRGPGLFYDIVHYDRPGRATVGRYLADQILEVIQDRGRPSGRSWLRSLFERPSRLAEADRPSLGSSSRKGR